MTFLQKSINEFILHIHPRKIDNRAIKFNRTFGLGGMLALLFVMISFTGLLLRFSYIPTVENAYDSILGIKNNTIFGQFIRNLHHLSAKLMVFVSFLHLIRVYYSQSIFQKRAENWIYGLLLFFLILASSFTGYLLPWDQLAYWAVTIITQIVEYIPLIGKSLAYLLRGSDTVDGNTLINFYSLHTGIIPLLFVVLMSVHFWLVRKAGGVALPKTDQKKNVDVIPNLLWKEIMTASILVGGLFIVSVFYEAPLLDQANPLKSLNPAKAPWYFLGTQELLLHLHPFFSAVIIPLSASLFFFGLPYFKYKNVNVGVWFNSELGKKISIQASIIGFVFTFLLIYISDHFLHFDIWFASVPSVITTGLIPFLLYVLPIAGYLLFWYKKHKTNNTELIMACTSVLLSSYICMTLISLLLRAEGMQLIF